MRSHVIVVLKADKKGRLSRQGFFSLNRSFRHVTRFQRVRRGRLLLPMVPLKLFLLDSYSLLEVGWGLLI